ncbi:hypothetical protein HK097_006917 [Rhizophlyctis rosea]|uniref:Oxidase ustYa n=1 Tax=Rhizophlyctis rosea TaxID=64517 RepID=A0AAD5SCB3_9FUNG|nr:hypothetical protein HK097_006917 [Rhizophlyctis rosea]
METKYDQDEEHQGLTDDGRGNVPLLKDRQRRNWIWLFRLGLEVFMAIGILVLLLRPVPVPEKGTANTPVVETATVTKSPIPVFPKKTVTFVADPNLLSDDMFKSEEDTLHKLNKWLPLSTQARGYVQIPNYQSYSLPEPYTVAINMTHDGPAYMISVFHQLHCLSYLVEHFQQGYAGKPLDPDVAHHSVHCFDYIRQALICNADVSLEGKPEKDTERGWGHKHVCTDYEKLLEWANEHSAMKWRGNLPDTATL